MPFALAFRYRSPFSESKFHASRSSILLPSVAGALSRYSIILFANYNDNIRFFLNSKEFHISDIPLFPRMGIREKKSSMASTMNERGRRGVKTGGGNKREGGGSV